MKPADGQAQRDRGDPERRRKLLRELAPLPPEGQQRVRHERPGKHRASSSRRAALTVEDRWFWRARRARPWQPGLVVTNDDGPKTKELMEPGRVEVRLGRATYTTIQLEAGYAERKRELPW